MSNITPSEGSDGNPIQDFSESTRENLNDDDVEERTDLVATRVLKDCYRVVQKNEASSRHEVENEEKKAFIKLEAEKKSDRVSVRKKQVANRKPASSEYEEKRRNLDELSKAASSGAVGEIKLQEALKLQQEAQQLREWQETLFSVDRANQSMQKAASNTLDLLRVIDQIDVENLEKPRDFTDFVDTAEKLLKILRDSTNPLNEHDLYLRSSLFHAYYERLHKLFSEVTRFEKVKHITLRCFKDDHSPILEKWNVKLLFDEWKRSMISASLVDCGFPSDTLKLELDKEKNPTEEFLCIKAQEMFNVEASKYSEIQTRVLENPCGFSDHRLVEANLKFSTGEERKIQFFASEFCSKILNFYKPRNIATITLNSDEKNLDFPVRKSFNCYSFATGYETENTQSLIPGALPKESKTHPIAWVSDKVLQDQGLIRIDNFLCKNLNYDFLKIQNPVYLVAIIHSGKFHGSPDAHVMRCFYNPSDKNLVWLQSGGTKRVTFVKRSNDQLITGIPQNPVDTFCRTEYPCFLGYYLVMDSVKLLEPTGQRAQYVSV